MAVLKLNSEDLLSIFGLDDVHDTAKLHTVPNLNAFIFIPHVFSLLFPALRVECQ